MAIPPTGTVTFLFTDIEGSTKMWESRPQAMQAALARHDEILREAIEERGGYVFKTVGDAFCCAFPTAPNALEAALEAQRTLFSEEWEETGPLRVRMALHTGATEERDGDYFGPPVNRVARLLSTAHGAQMLLSLATQELVRDQLPPGTNLRDLEEHRLKDLFRPEHVFQVVAPGLPEEFPPLRTLESAPNNLPLQPTIFIGREREVEEVRGRLLSPEVRLLTLTGPGGTGKTRLALQVAAEVLEEFPDGVFFVPLASVGDPGLVASTIARTLRVVEVGDKPLVESLKDHLRGRRMLLVLDNFEQVLEATPLLDELMGVAPGLRLLVTSRAPLRLYGERSFPVPPLSVPDPRRLPDLKALSQYGAVRLFIERAQDAKPDFEVTSENAPAVAEICARLDGLPLAIELAAARIRLLTPKAMLSRLSNRLKVVTGGAKNLPERQRTLRGAIEWSHDLLDEDERVLFARLSVFAGGRTLEAMEAICDAGGDLGVDLLDGVESLVEKSLLRQEEGPNEEPRFVMLETIHEYAREKLQESGEVEDVRRLHAEFFLAMTEEAEPELTGPNQLEWMERVEVEHDNMRAALRWSLGGGDAELGLHLAGALSHFWFARGHFGEGRGWLEEALAEGGSSPANARAKALRGLGNLTVEQGDYERAKVSSEGALALYQELGDQKGVADSLGDLGWAVMFRGDDERAMALFEESLVAARESKDDWSISYALNALSVMASDRGDFERAEVLGEESLALARKLGDARRRAAVLGNMGLAEVVRGDFERAEALFAEELALGRELKAPSTIANASVNLGIVVTRRGDLERARTLLEEGLVLLGEMGAKEGIAEGLESLAGLAGASGDYGRVARLWGAADALRESIGAPWLPLERRLHKPYLEAIRSRCMEAVWKNAWEEGRAMTMEDAIAYALGEGTKRKG